MKDKLREFDCFMAFFSFSKTGCLANTVESSLPNYLPIAGGRREDWIMPFQMTLAQGETLATTSRIWTEVTDFISYDDNRYTADRKITG